MPLHAQDKGMGRIFESFNDPVFTAGVHLHAVTRNRNRLMMETVDLDAVFPDDVMQQRSRFDVHLMDQKITRNGGGLCMDKTNRRDLIRDVTVKLPARGHIHDLDPAANTEDRPVSFQGQLIKPGFDLVPKRPDTSDAWVLLPAVTFGLHIPAPGEQQPVTALPDHIQFIHREIQRDQKRQSAGFDDRSDIGGAQ